MSRTQGGFSLTAGHGRRFVGSPQRAAADVLRMGTVNRQVVELCGENKPAAQQLYARFYSRMDLLHGVN